MLTKFSALLIATSLLAQPPVQSKGELAQGLAAYKANRYAEAIAHFQRATALDPANLEAQSYLASAYLVQWVPGVESSENQENHDLAVSQFRAVLDKDPANSLALSSLASIAYNSATSGSTEQRAAALEEAVRWNERRRDATPNEPEPYYYLGIIAWMKAFAPIQNARIDAKLRASDAGPIPDLPARIELQSRYSEGINGGIANLKKCLALDPKNEDAMGYLNLLLRKKADLEDSVELAKADVAEAKDWSTQALQMKIAKASEARPANGYFSVGPTDATPVPMPLRDVPSSAPPPNSNARPTVSTEAAEEHLTHKVEPLYPPLARSTGTEGQVRFRISISPEGNVDSTELVRGHPLLVNAAREAVMQWTYRPFVLDGKPTSVLTEVTLNFSFTR